MHVLKILAWKSHRSCLSGQLTSGNIWSSRYNNPIIKRKRLVPLSLYALLFNLWRVAHVMGRRAQVPPLLARAAGWPCKMSSHLRCQVALLQRTVGQKSLHTPLASMAASPSAKSEVFKTCKNGSPSICASKISSQFNGFWTAYWKLVAHSVEMLKGIINVVIAAALLAYYSCGHAAELQHSWNKQYIMPETYILIAWVYSCVHGTQPPLALAAFLGRGCTVAQQHHVHSLSTFAFAIQFQFEGFSLVLPWRCYLPLCRPLWWQRSGLSAIFRWCRSRGWRS